MGKNAPHHAIFSETNIKEAIYNINMADGGVMAVSVVLGFLVLVSMHWYYPQNELSQIVEQAALESPATGGFAFGPLISFSVGILIEYLIVVFAIYLFLRSVMKRFGRD
jgi:hypothetical protein